MPPSAATDQPESKASGQLIGGRYQVLAALGKGGAAQIYRVLDTGNNSQLALKQLHASAAAKLSDLFELEYRTLASFDHPHTVRVYEFGHDPDGPFYTMELLEGGDLGAAGALSWRSACRHLADAAQALGLLHARNLIHRDVSPRNLWRTPDGRVKLIDFGALAAFGDAQVVIGTPPCIPPEAFERRGMDQRADLYALGAVAYFLLTGQHAYPARALSDLQLYWGSTPMLPSQCVLRLGRTDLEPIPRELDTLVLSLLQRNAQARPSSCGEVLDRLHSMLGQAHDSDVEAALARLTNSGFVGRTTELHALSQQLELSLAGRGQVAVIEGAAGVGRTRLLAELARQARVQRATVLEVAAARELGSYSVAAALVLGLLEAQPELAHRVAAEHRAVLAHIPRLRARLGAQPAHFPPVASELRVRLQEAFSNFLCGVAREMPVIVLLDGLELTDEESAAVFHRLALDGGSARLMLVCSLVREAGRELRAVERAIHKLASVQSLTTLNELEHKAVLQSVLGEAEHLSRLSARLYRVTHGNPAQTIELCKQLVQRGTVELVNGTWVLPRELSDVELQTICEHPQSTRLDALPDRARQLLRLLSVHEGPLSDELIEQLAGLELAGQVPELVARELLVPAQHSLLFAHEQLRMQCARELTPEAEQRARRCVAEHTLASPSASDLERARAGLHLLASGDERGAGVIVAAALSCTLSAVERLAALAPCIEQALQLFRANGRPAIEQVVLLATLARAGYEVDPRYSTEYAEQAIHALEELLGLPRARRWRRYLGARAGFLCSLACAAFALARHRKNPCVPSVQACIRLLVLCVFATTATRTTFLDADGAARSARALEPFQSLGPENAGAFMYELNSTVAETTRDVFPDVLARWQKVLARLESKKPFRRTPPELFTVTRGGALYALGTIVAHRDDAWALHCAEQLDSNGYALDHAYAAQVRVLYYGYHGMLEEYARCRERVDQLAVQHGTSWQTEVWAPGPESAIALLLHDAMAMKRAAERMKRLSASAPTLRVHARYMFGAYLLMRGRSGEALAWLEDCLHEAPCSRLAWGRAHGLLARAYNHQGLHEKARAACLRVLDHFSAEQFDFPALNMCVLTELAIAEAQLGDVTAARTRIAALFQRFQEHQNPLTLGHLHETLLEVALIAEDTAEAQAQFTRMKELYQAVATSSLMQRCDVLQAALDGLTGDGQTRGPSGLSTASTTTADLSSQLALLMDPLLASKDLPFAERAATALRALSASVRASRGVLALIDEETSLKVIATLDDRPVRPQLEAWMIQRLHAEQSEPDTVLSGEPANSQGLAGLSFQDDGLVYSLTLLSRMSERGSELFAVAALGGDRTSARACPAELLRAISDVLAA